MYRVELKVSLLRKASAQKSKRFLMYRVELKEKSGSVFRVCSIFVPNVPCGVESAVLRNRPNHVQEFLMYRVELKGSICSSSPAFGRRS